ncbi:hypothetical protein ACO22_07441 [Paracoccidioides brasiliensis]|uniref:Uncharacterized protein n=1 Tax=Paracoccidioides brasiliensis TaxID=121759 RepID=A0A1D2J4N7_PARBR|nr:hypothetical protein ACO22_07441 [Paracoccidioides brasiliensis]
MCRKRERQARRSSETGAVSINRHGSKEPVSPAGRVSVSESGSTAVTHDTVWRDGSMRGTEQWPAAHSYHIHSHSASIVWPLTSQVDPNPAQPSNRPKRVFNGLLLVFGGWRQSLSEIGLDKTKKRRAEVRVDRCGQR